MSRPHVIRLREPWDRESIEGGRVRYRRFFNMPTGLTTATTVLIVCDGPSAAFDASLNGAPLHACAGSEAQWSCDVTQRLMPRNELTLEMTTALPSQELPWREVRLEIHAA